jgi:hypothetical protein
VATAGRSMGVVVREQLARQLDASTMQTVDAALAAVRAGTKPKGLPKTIAPLFNDNVLAYLRSVIDVNPIPFVATSKARRIEIIQGDMDMQVSVDDDARKLAAAVPDGTSDTLPRRGLHPKAQLTIVTGMAHTLKIEKERKLPQPSYLDPAMPLAAPLVDAVAASILRQP